MLITEDFLHYVWKFRLFDHASLQTTDGDELEILSPGGAHADSGPDFQDARLRISDATWAGNIEIHVSSADWQRHQHQTDKAYSNIILHVVYRDDEPLILPDGRKVPTLELQHRIPDSLYNRYHELIFSNQQFIPCEGTINTVDSLTLRNWLTRVLVERMEKKSGAVLMALNNARGDWEEIFYRFLAANFGFKTNALPFELMAKSLPQNILGKHKNNSLQIEALIFGQSGFLEEDFADDYPRRLKAEYSFLRKKYNLTPIEKHLWKFLRLRPQNFPTIRLAQFAALVVNSNHLFSKILATRDVPALRALFAGQVVNNYWEIHYRFDALSKPAVKNMGIAAIDNLLLNTVALFLFSYGKSLNKQHYVDSSLQLLETLPAEKNHITDDFSNLGLKISTAFESQGLLELNKFYCSHKKCLHCAVGNKILKLS
jgi:hypothetical protein